MSDEVSTASCESSPPRPSAISRMRAAMVTMLTATPPFTEAVRTSAELRGMPSIKWAIVDHPVASLKEGELRQRAIESARQFHQLMRAPVERKSAA